ncbi:hypothetical protein ACFRCQ_22785 [Cytobacillus firmus]|uniref:hypothetical protein n=1 Tax=Bacillaceae TaxID=186817 RepID=UPI0004AE2805|nr:MULTISPECIES: hypothetical protein [Bacillaceae]MBN8203894.1 hypothetical protein [Bacillus sp. NTK034]
MDTLLGLLITPTTWILIAAVVIIYCVLKIIRNIYATVVGLFFTGIWIYKAYHFLMDKF